MQCKEILCNSLNIFVITYPAYSSQFSSSSGHAQHIPKYLAASVPAEITSLHFFLFISFFFFFFHLREFFYSSNIIFFPTIEFILEMTSKHQWSNWLFMEQTMESCSLLWTLHTSMAQRKVIHQKYITLCIRGG